MKQQIKDESKEVKEGGEGFTKGEWQPVFGRHKEGTPIFGWGIMVEGRKANVCLQGIYEHHVGVNLWDGKPVDGCYTPEESEANCHLIAQSKNMYYCLLDFMDIVRGISSVPTGSQLTVTIPASLFENASIVLQKATPKK